MATDTYTHAAAHAVFRHTAKPAALLLATAAFVWGVALLVVVPIYNLVLPTRLRPFRGGYFTAAAIPWSLHNGLVYLVRFTFLPFVTLTPFGTWFLRAMGMRMGRRPRITTEFISDPCMITLGDDVALGGSAHLFCHYSPTPCCYQARGSDRAGCGVASPCVPSRASSGSGTGLS